MDHMVMYYRDNCCDTVSINYSVGTRASIYRGTVRLGPLPGAPGRHRVRRRVLAAAAAGLREAHRGHELRGARLPGIWAAWSTRGLRRGPGPAGFRAKFVVSFGFWV